MAQTGQKPKQIKSDAHFTSRQVIREPRQGSFRLTAGRSQQITHARGVAVAVARNATWTPRLIMGRASNPDGVTQISGESNIQGEGDKGNRALPFLTVDISHPNYSALALLRKIWDQDKETHSLAWAAIEESLDKDRLSDRDRL